MKPDLSQMPDQFLLELMPQYGRINIFQAYPLISLLIIVSLIALIFLLFKVTNNKNNSLSKKSPYARAAKNYWQQHHQIAFDNNNGIEMVYLTNQFIKTVLPELKNLHGEQYQSTLKEQFPILSEQHIELLVSGHYQPCCQIRNKEQWKNEIEQIIKRYS